ncbi:LppP/LprE family lipoprotein [Corynebacterium variabile]|uniref:LppP/LprE family lipoprotein n=1 Tax=Corynebacterium variabile TaxID=1727 RepID=UPI001476B03A
MTWVYHGESNYDPCVALSYATVVQSEVGDAQFQNQLMLFHDGGVPGCRYRHRPAAHGGRRLRG